MHSRRRRPRPPWERRNETRRHPIGRTRRRWPRAYDGGVPAGATLGLNPRYHRVYDGGNTTRRRRPALQRLRQHPVKSGLIGLAVAGVAAPIGVNRYQEALRADPSHERIVTRQAQRVASEAAVRAVWETMERERVVEEHLAENAEYQLSRDLAEDIYDAAKEATIEPEVAFGLVRAESSFRSQAKSVVGAVGLTQLMPRTASWLEPGVSRQDLQDEKTNLRIGMKYLKYLLDRYEGDVKLALTAYNRGPGTVDKVLRRGGNPDNGYADFVFGKKNHGHTLFTTS